MYAFFLKLLNMSAAGAVLILALILIRAVLNRGPRRANEIALTIGERHEELIGQISPQPQLRIALAGAPALGIDDRGNLADLVDIAPLFIPQPRLFLPFVLQTSHAAPTFPAKPPSLPATPPGCVYTPNAGAPRHLYGLKSSRRTRETSIRLHDFD